MKPPITSDQIEAALDQAFKAVFQSKPKGAPMRYEWEYEITQDMLNKINDILPDGLVLRGAAVENVISRQGAMVERTGDGYLDCIAPVDVWTDIKGDTDRIREGYFLASRQRRHSNDTPRETNPDRPSKNPFEPMCVKCGLPHPKRNPYCFCDPDQSALRTATLEDIRKIRDTDKTRFDLPVSEVARRIKDGDIPPHPLLPNPNSDGTYDRRHLWAYAVAAMQCQRDHCIAHAQGMDGPPPANCEDLPDKATS